jgi:hypothetical protein
MFGHPGALVSGGSSIELVSLLVLALQSGAEPPDEAPERYTVAFGRLAQYWVPRFRGKIRVDGNATAGTLIDAVDDLDMSDRVAIPMFSGGDIGFSISPESLEKVDLIFVAEYWTHQWAGHDVLRAPETLGDVTFPSGTPLESRLTLTNLVLDVVGSVQNGAFRAGLALSLMGTYARIRMDAPPLSSKEVIQDACWGGGAFFQAHPVRALFFGGSAKGFASFRHSTESGTGDFRVYGGVEWKVLRLEVGYRAWIHDLETREQTLQYFLHGPYAAIGMAVRF